MLFYVGAEKSLFSPSLLSDERAKEGREEKRRRKVVVYIVMVDVCSKKQYSMLYGTHALL